jgi:CPA1 family monovalent cation:H+ antiporter
VDATLTTGKRLPGLVTVVFVLPLLLCVCTSRTSCPETPSRVSTILYLLIGAEVRIGAFFEYAELVIAAAVLVLVARAVTIYPLVSATNLVSGRPVPVYCQHVMVWGGLHTVVPVALALSLPTQFPFREKLQVMVFGVAIISIVVQGLLLPGVLTRLGIGKTDAG